MQEASWEKSPPLLSSGGVVELACGFQANVYLFAVYCNRAGLTLEAILCSVQNVHGTVLHLKKKKKKPARETTEAERKKRGGVRGTHINPVQKKKKITSLETPET